jgi:hypothetical protein
MANLNADIKHDFINNSLRLEVLSKIVCEDLNKDNKPQKQHIDDLEDFFNVGLNLLIEIKNQIHLN